MEPLAAPPNPYAPPRAELDASPAPPATGFSPNLAAAVEGRYDFTVGDAMDEAWRLVKGMKGTFWGAALVITPVTMGLSMMCVRRALGAPISFGTAFSYVSKSGTTALIAGVLVVLAIFAGLLALIIPGIYLMVAYSFVIQLVGDQGLSPWQAMEISRKAVTHRWWSVLGLTFLVAILTVVSALGLLIPLIWTIPWMMMTIAVLYRRMFYAVDPPADGTTA